MDTLTAHLHASDKILARTYSTQGTWGMSDHTLPMQTVS